MKKVWGLAALLVVLGCGEAEPASEDVVARAPSELPVDSALPMDVLLERFRADLTEPEALRSGAGTRDALVGRIVEELENADTLAFEGFAIDRAEFAWLYFPTNMLARPPYEMPPGIAWLQIQQRNRTGVLRALRELGGRPLDYRGYACDPQPEIEGENRLWTSCVVTIAPRGAKPQSRQLFGKILERDGRFAIVTYANDF